MLCSICGKDNVYVVDNVFVAPSNIEYRRRKCKDCGNVFYTVESLCEQGDDLVKQEWNKYHRISTKRMKIRKARENVRDEL